MSRFYTAGFAPSHVPGVAPVVAAPAVFPLQPHLWSDLAGLWQAMAVDLDENLTEVVVLAGDADRGNRKLRSVDTMIVPAYCGACWFGPSAAMAVVHDLWVPVCAQHARATGKPAEFTFDEFTALTGVAVEVAAEGDIDRALELVRDTADLAVA